MSNEEKMLAYPSLCVGEAMLHHRILDMLDVIRAMPASIFSAEGLHQGVMTLISTFPFDRKLAKIYGYYTFNWY